MKFKASSFALTLLAGLAIVAGCGGSDGDGRDGSQTPTNVFISDDLNAGYDGVWVTLHEIQLVHANGSVASVFESQAGETINLSNLNDGAARFMFLSRHGLNNGAYTSVKVTMDNDLTLYPTGATTGTAAQFDPALNGAAGMTDLSLTLTPPFVVGANNDDIVIDFDLANWEIAGNIVTPVIAVNNGVGMGLGDDNRQERRDYRGTVESLSGTIPNQAFTLSTPSGSFRVQLSSETIVFNNDGTGTATLANGQRVEVRGRFSASTNTLLAGRVKIKATGDGDNEPEVKGIVSEANTAAGTFKVSTQEVSGFQPMAGWVNIETTVDTTFFTKRGVPVTKDEFFVKLAELGTDVRVEVEGGTYSSVNNTLTARKVKLEDDGDNVDDHEESARGKVFAVNAEQGTFDITLQEWYGFQGQTGLMVGVETNPETEYLNPNGDAVTKAEFFAMLTTNAIVQVHGNYDADVITATRLQLKA